MGANTGGHRHAHMHRSIDDVEDLESSPVTTRGLVTPPAKPAVCGQDVCLFVMYMSMPLHVFHLRIYVYVHVYMHTQTYTKLCVKKICMLMFTHV
jgi:hypothetical protein